MNPTKPPAIKRLDGFSDDELGEVIRRSFALPEVPTHTVQAAIDLWSPPRPSMADLARAAVSRATALLTFDSWAAAPLALGMRAVPSGIRHLLFSADGRDIDLRIAPAAEKFSLSGQILGPDEAGDVELRLRPDVEDPREPRRVALDSLGEFHFDGVDQGIYVMTLRLSGEIVLPPIDVGDRRR